jgi:hypothetical protein
LTDDARYVAFESFASNLVQDSNGTWDVFVRDRSAATTVRASVSSSNKQGNGASRNADIAALGRYVVFESLAANLVSGDRNAKTDIFLRDLTTGTTTRVSVSSAGTEGNGDSRASAISADGRYIAFLSHGSNLVSGDTNNKSDIFVRDRVAGTTTRVSVSSSGAQGDQDVSGTPSISADGRYVGFGSSATTLAPNDTNGVSDSFVRDLTTGTTTRVSTSSFRDQANAASSSPDISANGSAVAYSSDATNLTPNDFNGEPDVFVHELGSGLTSRVSLSSAGQEGNDSSGGAVISADGRYVAFSSLATTLKTPDGNVGDALFSGTDTFIHDRNNASTTIVSVTTSGSQVFGHHSGPDISADGRYVAFHSGGSSLVSGDTNGAQDIFLRDRGAPPAPPAVRLDVPGNDQEVFGSQSLAATLLPGFSATRIDFLVDGAVVASDSSAPYSATWNTTGVSDGKHTLVARAVGSTGSDSVPVSVAVINQRACERKIEADFAAERLAVDDYVAATVYCTFEARLLAPRYAQSSAPLGHDLSFEVAMSHWDEVSPAVQSELLQFVSDVRNGYYSTIEGAAAASGGAATASVQYTCNGDPGFRGDPRSDCEYMSSDARFRMKFALQPATDGISATDSNENGVPDKLDDIESNLRDALATYAGMRYDVPPTPPAPGASPIVVVMHRHPFTRQDGTVAPPGTLIGVNEIWLAPEGSSHYLPRHELFHLIQWRYASGADYYLTDGTKWWAEATAEWAEHQIQERFFVLETDSYYDQLDGLLADPGVALDHFPIIFGDRSRAYGSFLFAEYLEERFGELVIRRTWERIRDPDGLGATDAIDSVLRSAEFPAGGLPGVLPDFWAAAYRLNSTDFPDPTVVPAWRGDLEQPGLTTNGDATNEEGRPARTRLPLVGGETVTGVVQVQPGGAEFVDLANETNRAGLVSVRVANYWGGLLPTDDAIHVRILTFGSYPEPCPGTESQDLEFSGGIAAATVSLPLGCPFATLVVTNDEPASSNRTVAIQASFQAGAGPGDVVVSMKGGRVGVFRPDGTPIASWSTGVSGLETGMDFDSNGILHVTNFTANSVSRLSTDGTLLGTFGSGYLSQPESIQFASTGDAFVGHSAGDSVQKRHQTGSLLDTYAVAVEATGGSDWIALRPDECTLVYTSRGTRVLQFDVCTRQQLADFASVAQPAYGIALLPDGGALVAGNSVIRRLNAQGSQTMTYDVSGTNSWFGIALDPDGSTFWVTDGVSANVYRFPLSGGAPLSVFPSGTTPCAPGSSSFPLGGITIIPQVGGGGASFQPASAEMVLAPNESPNALPP